jgi:hypothetical protein
VRFIISKNAEILFRMAQDWPTTITNNVPIVQTQVVQVPVPVASPPVLTKREQMAMFIASGLWANQFAFGPIGEGLPGKIADMSVAAADALLVSLAKTPPVPMPAWDKSKL